MMRFLGNTVAKIRGFSSGMITASSSKLVGYCFNGAFCGAGYVIGGLATTSVAPEVKEVEEMIIRNNEFLDEQEAILQELMKP